MAGLRIALVHPYPWTEVRRGGERYLHDLAWYLAGAGHSVDVLVGARGGPRVEQVDGATVRRLPRLEPEVLARRGVGAVETHGAVALAALLRRRYDVVHALTPTGALAGAVSRHPTVYTELGHPNLADTASRFGGPRTYRAVMRRATIVAALSASAARAVAEVGGRSAEVLPAGVRTDVFSPAGARPSGGPPRLLFLGDASVPRKGVHLALAALDLVLERHPGARLLLGGPGDHSWAVPGLGDRAERVLAAVDVLGVGEAADLPHRYRAATVTLMPSEHEALGLVLLESLACGTPIVCTAEGGMAEVADAPGVGATFPTGDERGLAEAVSRAVELARDPATTDRCVARGRRWGWAEEVGPAHEDAYARALSLVRGPRPRP